MADPFLGQISIFSFPFAPKGWAFCNGQIMSIQQNAALFALLGTTYGGNGQSTFGLPNLQGRTAISFGQDPGSGIVYTQGETAGEANHTLLTQEMPQHNHFLVVNPTAANNIDPAGSDLAASSCTKLASAYGATINTTMNAQAILNNGNSQPHNNLQPYLTVSICICIQGVFPSRN